MKKITWIIRFPKSIEWVYMSIIIILLLQGICLKNRLQFYKDKIILREAFLVQDLQIFLNAKDNPRYFCGKIDGVLANKEIRRNRKTLTAIHNFLMDANAKPYFEEEKEKKNELSM